MLTTISNTMNSPAYSVIQQASTRRYNHQIDVYPERMPTDFRLARITNQTVKS